MRTIGPEFRMVAELCSSLTEREAEFAHCMICNGLAAARIATMVRAWRRRRERYSS